MPDAADDRHGMPDHGPDDRLVVERPEVFERTATAREDRHLRGIAGPAIAFASLDPAPDAIERGDDRRRRRIALHKAGHEQDAGQRPATRDHVVDVVPDRARRARDHGNDGRSVGQRSLSRTLEEPLGREPGFERLEPQRQVTEPGGLERRHVQLVDALRVEDVDPAACDDA